MSACKWGHDEGRDKRGNCKVCAKERIRRWVLANPDKKAAIAKRYNATHPEDPEKKRARAAVHRQRYAAERAAYNKAWREANPDKVNAKARRWRERNAEAARVRRAQWSRDNPDKQNALIAKRRARKLSATPVWADHTLIEAVYAEAQQRQQETGVPHHVDHIVPLAGKYVCGLHVHYNLRAIPAAENYSKGNRLCY